MMNVDVFYFEKQTFPEKVYWPILKKRLFLHFWRNFLRRGHVFIRNQEKNFPREGK